MRLILSIFCVVIITVQCDTGDQSDKRKSISLNGEWELAENRSAGSVPSEFSRKIPVPGLADMAEPAFDSIGYNRSDSRYLWYKRTFILEENTPVVRLKINKAKFGTKVFINGEPVGYRKFCFTPTVYEIQDYLKEAGEENEVVIRVGAAPKVLPDTIPYGHDFEKIRYLPGIYDNVKLLCSNKPFISNLQIAPDIEKGQIKVQASLKGIGEAGDLKLSYRVTEDSSGNVVNEGTYDPGQLSGSSNGLKQLTWTIPVPDAHLWTPEDPFLYNLQLSTGGDVITERFGMRTFRMDQETGRAYLNGRPYFMRGTNVCIFRFFEDPNRGELPWKNEWIRNLHQKFKSMHWNSIRYCIGYPPEKWYDIADEEGFLIQNEYPLWGNTKVSAPVLTEAYKAAMKTYWNHPCVVIWDAQNETFTDASGKAIQNVRGLDMSDRPWDNGWAPPQKKTDAIETHPYLFSRYSRGEEPPKEYLKNFLEEPRIPDNGPSERSPKENGRYQNAIIINEYAWLWLNRNGTTTTLTDEVYGQLLGKDVSRGKRLEFYTHHLGMLTEYWRAHRKCAGVLHFCGLGYSRPEKPRGQTSDNFTDIHGLNFEPHFLQYVKPAFSPVGLMIDRWKIYHKPGAQVTVPVYLINDTYEEYSGRLRLSVEQNGDMVTMQRSDVRAEKLGRTIWEFSVTLPEKPGKYRLVAEIGYNKRSVKSIRDIVVE